MVYPPDFERKLGFDAIRERLTGFCLSPLGRKIVGDTGFLTDPKVIRDRLSETAEMLQIILFEDRFPAQDYYDMTPELARIRIPGTYMETGQLSELRLSALTIAGLVDFIGSRSERFPSLNLLININAAGFRSVADRIYTIVDEKSEVRDNASAELQRIRRVRESLIAAVEREILRHFKSARQNGWTPDEAEITIRNGRLVIPLTASNKRKVSGFIHDESATGHTVYVEPAEVFERNNEVRELEYAERREIIRILVALADEIRFSVDELFHGYQFLGLIDSIRAKGLFAREINATVPMHLEELSAPGIRKGFTWNQAIHPLLLLAHRKAGKSVVPLDIRLTPGERILVISGPNAGGKSVCLKTTGLIQYMFQCGLLPPVREDSEFCLFRKIFIDIGDEQSIDNDLSTYTSKLLNLKFFLENTDDGTLFLIDEFGSGTDPSLGGAIAEATLETLNGMEAMGVVTTHYSNLKLLAGKRNGIVNGAMLYDLNKLKPLFKLQIGYPGSSFALEIAREIGFPTSVLENAQSKTGHSQLDFDRELQTLEVEKEKVTRQKSEIEVADTFLAELIGKYQKLQSELESKKKEILSQAREEARKILEDSNRIVEKTIREIKESQAEKERTRTSRSELQTVKDKLLKEIAVEPPAVKPAAAPPASTGTPQPGRFSSYINEYQNTLTNFRFTLDVRGMRADETLAALRRYIDDAVMLSIPEVQILHGKGNGILRQVTRDYLRSVREIKSVRDAHIEQGGAGITVVIFK